MRDTPIPSGLEHEERPRGSADTAADILNAMSEVAMVISRDLTILAASPGLAASLDKPLTSLIGTPALPHLPAYVAASRGAHLAEVLHSCQPAHFEDENGGRVFANSIFPVLDPHGRVSRMAAFCWDITDRKRAEQDLQESERRFREMADLLPDMVFELDPDFRVTYINRAMTDILGYTRADLNAGSDAREALGSEPLVAAMRGLGASAESGGSRMGVHALRRRDGTIVPTEIHAMGVVGPNGELVGYRGVMRDVTARQQVEAEVRDALARLQRFVDVVTASPAIVFISREGHPDWLEFLSANVEQWGYSAADFTADRGLWANIMHPDDVLRTQDEVTGHLAKGTGHFAISYRVLTSPGEIRWVEQTTNVVVDATGVVKHYAGLVIDVTDRKRAEDAQRLAAVGQLAAGVGHEFNNLLAGLILEAELTAEDRTAERYDGLVATALAVATHGRDVCKNLTTFALPAVPRREPLHVEATLESALALTAHQLENAEVVVARDYGANGQRVHADGGQLQQVFVNLLVNACHAMPQGGNLAVETRHVPRVEGGGDIVVTITDTGTGIEPEHLPRIFEPFFTTKGRLGESDTPGTGLGLSVSHGIIRAHGGEITARSEVGSGTTFELVLPAYAAPSATPTADEVHGPQAAVAASGRSASVLVAEDAVPLASLAKAVLTANGHRVTCVHTTQAAVASLRANRYDLVITDLLMPGGGGREIVSFARSTEKPPPILVITGLTGPQVEADVSAMGAGGVVHKPFTRAELTQAVEELLAREGG